MGKGSIMLTAAVLTLCMLFACGIRTTQTSRVPMAQSQDQIKALLTPLPQALGDVRLLGRGESIYVEAEDSGIFGVYEIKAESDAYRRMSLPVDQTWRTSAMVTEADGGLWLTGDAGGTPMLLKISSSGTLIHQTTLTHMAVSAVGGREGAVFLGLENGTIQWISSEGEPLGELSVGTAPVYLAMCRQQLYAFCTDEEKPGEYWTIGADFTLGETFSGCVSGGVPVGAFLPAYTVMEGDSAGLYGRREDGQWEMICRWSQFHLDGTVYAALSLDVDGNGITIYRKNGASYCLTLRAA